MTTLALLGSGEFLPWALDADRWTVERAAAGSDRVLVLPTASAPEGEDVFSRWAAMGVEHYRALGLAPEVVELRTRADASERDIVDAVAGARLLFFSGGNPGYLCETLAGTPFWDAVVDAVANGTALGGCSAGAVAVGSLAPFVHGERLDRWVDGLRLLPRAFVLPHFDQLDSYAAGLREAMLARCPDGCVVVGIDEDTALLGDGERWEARGKGAAWIREEPDGDLRPVRDGESAVVRLVG